jgi:hypothetical protein
VIGIIVNGCAGRNDEPTNNAVQLTASAAMQPTNSSMQLDDSVSPSPATDAQPAYGAQGESCPVQSGTASTTAPKRKEGPKKVQASSSFLTNSLKLQKELLSVEKRKLAIKRKKV